MNGKYSEVVNSSLVNASLIGASLAEHAVNDTSLGDIQFLNKSIIDSAIENTLSISSFDGKIERKIKVLLLEDNKINQMLAVEMLAMLGIHSVDVVENGFLGLEKAMVNLYDIIITDIKMPVMDGLEFTKNIRKIDQYKSIPIIALTANVQEEQVENYYKVGMNNCLMKPVNIIEFEKILVTYLT